MEPVISIRNLIAKYGDLTVLDDISVDIFPGEITVILGSSGCGKTTLLKNILRLVEPVSGSVKFWGEEILDLDDVQMEKILCKLWSYSKAVPYSIPFPFTKISVFLWNCI